MADRVEDTKEAIVKADIQSADGAPPEESQPRGRGGRVIRPLSSERDQGLEASAPGSRDVPLRRPTGEEAATDTNPGLKDGLLAQELAAEGMDSPGTRGRARARSQGR